MDEASRSAWCREKGVYPAWGPFLALAAGASPGHPETRGRIILTNQPCASS
jgi:hypothetical protein